MTTLTKTDVQGGSAPPVKGSGDAGMSTNCMFQASSSPAALAAPIIHDIMAMYGEITSLVQQQNATMAQVRSLESQAGASATIAGGDNMFAMYLTMAISTAVGAAAGFAIQTGMSQFGDGGKITEEENKAKSELQPLKAVESSLTLPAEEKVGGPPPAAETAEQKVARETREARLREFESHDFSKAGDNEETKDAIKTIKAKGMKTVAVPADATPEGAEAIAKQNAATKEGWENWHDKFNDAIERKSQDYNSALQKQTTRQNFIGTIKGLSDSAFQSVTHGSQAFGQQSKAKNDAAATLLNGAAQQAGESSSTLGQAASKAFDSQNAEMQIYRSFLESGNVRA